MIKNLVFDIGGVIFDDSLRNISNMLGEDATDIYNKAYGREFAVCLLGNQTVSKCIETFKDDEDYDKIKYVLSKNNLHKALPLMKNNFDYISKLKDKGYNLYILSNITKESYEYVRSVIDIDKVFTGGIYSYQEKVKKPDKKIYEILIERYKLNKEETIFFDDKEKNINTAREVGIRGILFRSIEDIDDNLK